MIKEMEAEAEERSERRKRVSSFACSPLTQGPVPGRARDEEGDDLLMENPNHQAGGWRPHYEEDSETSEADEEEEEEEEDQEVVDTLAERLEETRV